jgi:hypothetical protein
LQSFPPLIKREKCWKILKSIFVLNVERKQREESHRQDVISVEKGNLPRKHFLKNDLKQLKLMILLKQDECEM